jgi:hypothetical protein
MNYNTNNFTKSKHLEKIVLVQQKKCLILNFKRMKKLLCIALFSMAIVASAANEKELLPIDVKEVTVEYDFSKEIKTDNSNFASDAVEVLVDCGEQGDVMYLERMADGLTHREARDERRAFVRNCRGGTWAWIGVCIGFIGHCD